MCVPAKSLLARPLDCCSEDQNQLLAEILSTGDDAVGMEISKDDADGKALHKGQLKGSMSARTGQKGALAESKPKIPAKRHQLFAKRFSGK